jgi:hypothetical protein
LRPAVEGKIGRNEYPWTQITSMVFLEPPAGGGFSYSIDRSLLADFNELRASLDSVKIIQKFFEKFSYQNHNSIFLAIEPYGGDILLSACFLFLSCFLALFLSFQVTIFLIGHIKIFNNPQSDDIRKNLKGFRLGIRLLLMLRDPCYGKCTLGFTTDSTYCMESIYFSIM